MSSSQTIDSCSYKKPACDNGATGSVNYVPDINQALPYGISNTVQDRLMDLLTCYGVYTNLIIMWC